MVSLLTSFNDNFSFLHASSQIEADVIFVHGLRGGPFMTWRQQDEKTSSGKNGTECWPRVMLWRLFQTKSSVRSVLKECHRLNLDCIEFDICTTVFRCVAKVSLHNFFKVKN